MQSCPYSAEADKQSNHQRIAELKMQLQAAKADLKRTELILQDQVSRLAS